MGKNKYVGHRYIPIFENGWDKTRTYEPLTFVYYEGKTYVSRQLVPTNIEIENNDFWAFFMDNAPQIFTPTFMGEWVDTEYEPLSIVINNGNTYVSKQDVPIGTVLTDTNFWLDLSTYYNQLFIEYENAEQERQQAELIRIENENQRQIEIEKIKDIVTPKMVNLVKNGDFSNGVNGWTINSEAVLTVTVDGCEITSTKNGLQIYQTIQVPIGDVLYTAVLIKSDTPSNYVLSTNQTGVPLNKDDIDFQFLSVVTKRNNVSAMSINAINVVNETHKAVLKYMIAINLTDVFGAGNEPTKEVMDWVIKENGYFDEKTLKRDDIQQYEINQLRKAVIALGGTV